MIGSLRTDFPAVPEAWHEAEPDVGEPAAVLQLQVAARPGHEAVGQELGAYAAGRPGGQPSAPR